MLAANCPCEEAEACEACIEFSCAPASWLDGTPCSCETMNSIAASNDQAITGKGPKKGACSCQ
jgi:hypothetical protein